MDTLAFWLDFLSRGQFMKGAGTASSPLGCRSFEDETVPTPLMNWLCPEVVFGTDRSRGAGAQAE